MNNPIIPKTSIEEIEAKMLVGNIEHVDCPVKHNFSDGVYVREIFMPGGSLIVGHEHTTKHLNIVSEGLCILLDTETGETTNIIAPCTFESDAGVRKVLYVIDDCVWSTVHVTEETDIDVLESTLIIQSEIHKQLSKKLIGG